MIRFRYSSGSNLGSIFIFILVLYSISAGSAVNGQRATSLVEDAASNRVGSELDEYGSEAGEGGEENISKSRFSWLNHEEDHGIYAHRSLLSTADIKNQGEDEEEIYNVYSDSRTNKFPKNSKYDEDDPLKTIDFAEKEWQLMFRASDLALDGVNSPIVEQILEKTDFFNEIVSRLKPECRRDIYHIRDSVKRHKLWALRMVDSMGKIPSGVTYGRFSSPGDYEECLSVNVNELIYNSPTTDKPASPQHYKFRGKYCLIDFRLPLPERPTGKLLSIHEPVINLTGTDIAEKFPIIKNYSAYASVFYEVGLMHALCLPTTCDVRDLVKSIGITLGSLHIIVNNTVDCEQRYDEPQPLRTSQKISLGLLVLLFSNAAVATVFHHYLSKDNKRRIQERHRETTSGRVPQMSDKERLKEAEGATFSSSSFRDKALKVMKQNRSYTDCFSIQKNFERLTKPDPRGLTFVHYTRIVAMALTVITHTAGMGTLQAITKPADASNSEQIFRDFLPQMLANAFTSIQIFFFMAGFMLVISSYPSIMRDKGRVGFLEYAIKRAIRLMPGLAATICLNFLWPLMVDGPMLSYFVRAIVVPCETNWWRTMSFLSNFDHVEKMCLRHSYFSASDYQLHIMAFPLLILLYKQPTIALFLAGLLTIGGFLAQVIMVLTKTVLPFMMVDYIDKEAFFNVVHYIHHPVWNHMSAFFYGFIVGYLVVKQIKIDLRPTTIKKIWLTVLPAGIMSIFAPYFWNHYKRPIYKWQMVLYVIIDRFILLTTCAWLSYASMVLGRPAPKKPDSPKLNLNLPEIVTIEHERDKTEKAKPANPNTPAVTGLLTSSSTVSSLPRQRSTPNIQMINQNNENSTAGLLRPAVSNINVSSVQGHTDQNKPSAPELVADAINQNQGKASEPKPDAPRRRPAPVSNINTLCLILSRLTFQLYLFNMVVLWIDVNHSKYFWFFSYYFIITKALAIYVCSSLMAIVFFVTMESPSLTLYIMWVKSRAQARADRREAREAIKGQGDRIAPSNIDQRQNIVASPQQSGPKMDTLGTGKSCLGGSLEGLCMRVGSPEPAGRPTFSFIDLSSASGTVRDESADTKM